MTKLIPLTKGKFAIVDDEDYEYLSQHKWHALKGQNTYYAARKTRGTGKFRGTVLMHREILKASDGMQVDHKDLNGLNNTRGNLREATISQNHHNIPKLASNTSGYKGVQKNKKSKKGSWFAHVKINNESIYLGSFSSPIEAAIAYDDAALKYHGEFANLNFPINERPAIIPKKLRKGNSDQQYIGISRSHNKIKISWEAKITCDGHHHYLGRYKTPEDAARAYDNAAKKYFGDRAILNFP